MYDGKAALFELTPLGRRKVGIRVVWDGGKVLPLVKSLVPPLGKFSWW